MMVSDDGFVTDAEGKLDWVVWGQEMDAASTAILGSADIFVAGYRAFADMASYWPNVLNKVDASTEEKAFAQTLCAMPRAVIGRKDAEPVWDEDFTFDAENLGEAISRLPSHFATVVAYGGVRTAQALIGESLVDELWLFMSPVSVKQGATLLKGGESVFRRFQLIEQQEFAMGGALMTLLPIRPEL